LSLQSDILVSKFAFKWVNLYRLRDGSGKSTLMNILAGADKVGLYKLVECS
jgi:hypothetical protein